MLWSTAIRTAGAISFFAIVHSLLAALPAKRRARRLAGARAADGLYRFAFNGFAVITFAATLRSIWPLPDRRLYRVRGVPSLVLWCGQLACVIGLLLTNRQNGFGHVTGIQHASEFVRGQSISRRLSSSIRYPRGTVSTGGAERSGCPAIQTITSSYFCTGSHQS